MRLPHSPELLSRLRKPSLEDPLRILVSGCLVGLPCGVDGTDYGMGGCLADLLALPTVSAIPFCPEESGLGTPRSMPDIHGGDGFDVLDGLARVLDENGVDLTDGMLRGAQAMLHHAREQAADLALLTDMSAACGTQVVSDGCRFDPVRKYRAGVGVAAAVLIRNAIPVVSQRDFRTLERLRRLLDPGRVTDPDARDHHETDWYRGYFNADSAP